MAIILQDVIDDKSAPCQPIQIMSCYPIGHKPLLQPLMMIFDMYVFEMF